MGDEMEQIDVWRTARLLVKEHGYEKALTVAAERAADLAVEGNERGALVFTAICECIRDLSRERGSEDVVN
jgi:hypothetical protein